MDYPIPKASAQAWQHFRRHKHQNPGLIFERFTPEWSRRPTLKKNGLEQVRDAARNTDEALLAAWNTRWEMGVQMAHATPFSLTTDWRFIPGLGRKGPLEVGFTFNRYGFPILPGSSVKGIARAWGRLEIAEALNTDQLKSLDNVLSLDEDQEYEKGESKSLADQFRTIFGTTTTAGQGIFFDAIPATIPKLELDIMNPHYPDYYQRNEPPTDSQNPVPIYFLTVAPGIEFRFAVGWRGKEDLDALQQAKAWLINGLTQLGAGAKTSAGYGYFKQGETR